MSTSPQTHTRLPACRWFARLDPPRDRRPGKGGHETWIGPQALCAVVSTENGRRLVADELKLSDL